MTKSSSPAILIVGASDRDADLLWASGFKAGDSFTFIEYQGRKTVILTDLEHGRGCKEAQVDEVASFSALDKRAREESGKPTMLEGVVARFLEERGISEVVVPARFPLRVADHLRERGIVVDSRPDPFFSGRAVKRASEIAHLERAQTATEEAMLFAIDLVARSEPGEADVLFLEGEALTSERLKEKVRQKLLTDGYQLGDLIIAPGDQGCDPHDTGSGNLHGGETIIIDIYPQHLESRYWGDMTRTVVRGEATEEQRAIHAAVGAAQQVALAAIAPGVTGEEVHRKVQAVFEGAGFPTEQRDGSWVGFFHGTGHGLGLDIHEPPRLALNGPLLEEGMVVTVEPGLYYPGIGGCRIEDVVLVTGDGCRNFNRLSRDLEV